MSNPPPAPEDTRLDPLVTPAAPAQHDCSQEAELSRSNPRHHLSQDSQGAQQVPSPSRAESPTVVDQWSQPPFTLKRSTTIPLENSSRPDTVHSPQLSERDSIFATHYLPSDSGANTPQLPPEKALDNERQVNLIPGLDDVSGSPSPVSKVSPHHSHVDPSHMEVDVRRHIPLRSSFFSSPAGVSRLSLLRSSISSDQAKDQEVEARARSAHSEPSGQLGTKTGGSHDILAERSPLPSPIDNVSHSSGLLKPPSSGHEGPMVNPGAAPHTSAPESSRGTPVEHGSSRGRLGRVDNSIEANLANAEPSSNVRSRKSSHYLGLFKENTTSPDRKRREDRARHQDEPLVSGDRAMDPGHQRLHVSSEEEGLLRKSISLPSLGDGPSFESPAQADPAHEGGQDEPYKRRPPALPRSLLEEIRNFHLTPGGGRGSSFSKSIPTQYAERGRDYFQQEPHVEHFSESLSSLEEGERRESLPFEDEEDHEQISSAVYFPHERVAVPEEVDDSQHLVADSHSVQTVQLSTVEKGHELMLVPQERSESPDQEVSHVDISFRSKNESKILHGDLSDLRSPTEGVSEKILSTISERSYDSTCDSEFISADESSQSLHEDSSLTDDAEVTPTATPIQRSRLLSKRKSKATGPVGAVELKPYRHQVGGHTTVFRFSRRAVCKQLNNRENEFYERIERRHPDMLVFLPRYVQIVLGCSCKVFEAFLPKAYRIESHKSF